MTQATDEPLSRALEALDQIRGVGLLDPVAEVAWQIAREALAEVQEEREALLAVARDGRELLNALHEHQGALASGNKDLITTFWQACGEAEDVLTASLARLRSHPEDETVLSGDAAYLAALDRVAANDD